MKLNIQIDWKQWLHLQMMIFLYGHLVKYTAGFLAEVTYARELPNQETYRNPIQGAEHGQYI